MATEFNSLSLRNDANLKAYYRLENTSEEVQAITITNNNSVAFNAAQFSYGADFGSSNTNKSLVATNDLGITGGAMSIALWIKLSAEISSGTWVFASQGDAGNDVHYIIEYQYNSGTRRMAFHRFKGPSTFDTLTYNITLGTSSWYHIALTYDSSTVRGYINGSEVGSGTSSSGNGTSGGVDSVSIGASWIPDAHTSAIIDDVVFFDDALTAAEVLNIYTGIVGDGFLAIL